MTPQEKILEGNRLIAEAVTDYGFAMAGLIITKLKDSTKDE